MNIEIKDSKIIDDINFSLNKIDSLLYNISSNNSFSSYHSFEVLKEIITDLYDTVDVSNRRLKLFNFPIQINEFFDKLTISSTERTKKTYKQSKNDFSYTYDDFKINEPDIKYNNINNTSLNIETNKVENLDILNNKIFEKDFNLLLKNTHIENLNSKKTDNSREFEESEKFKKPNNNSENYKSQLIEDIKENKIEDMVKIKEGYSEFDCGLNSEGDENNSSDYLDNNLEFNKKDYDSEYYNEESFENEIIHSNILEKTTMEEKNSKRNIKNYSKIIENKSKNTIENTYDNQELKESENEKNEIEINLKKDSCEKKTKRNDRKFYKNFGKKKVKNKTILNKKIIEKQDTIKFEKYDKDPDEKNGRKDITKNNSKSSMKERRNLLKNKIDTKIKEKNKYKIYALQKKDITKRRNKSKRRVTYNLKSINTISSSGKEKEHKNNNSSLSNFSIISNKPKNIKKKSSINKNRIPKKEKNIDNLYKKRKIKNNNSEIIIKKNIKEIFIDDGSPVSKLKLLKQQINNKKKDVINNLKIKSNTEQSTNPTENKNLEISDLNKIKNFENLQKISNLNEDNTIHNKNNLDNKQNPYSFISPVAYSIKNPTKMTDDIDNLFKTLKLYKEEKSKYSLKNKAKSVQNTLLENENNLIYELKENKNKIPIINKTHLKLEKIKLSYINMFKKQKKINKDLQDFKYNISDKNTEEKHEIFNSRDFKINLISPKSEISDTYYINNNINIDSSNNSKKNYLQTLFNPQTYERKNKSEGEIIQNIDKENIMLIHNNHKEEKKLIINNIIKQENLQIKNNNNSTVINSNLFSIEEEKKFLALENDEKKKKITEDLKKLNFQNLISKNLIKTKSNI